MQKQLLLLISALFISLSLKAQNEGANWYFGYNAGLSFASGKPALLPPGAMRTYEACASVSDGAGKLLFYTNSVNTWNSQHKPMSNGQPLGGHESASQGAAIMRRPGNNTQYYIFVLDGCENDLVGGLKYSLVDMSQQGGLGAITSRAVQVSTVRLTEKLTIIPHANGTDSWVMVHGWESDKFYAYLVSAAGIAAPVISAVGLVHSGGGGDLGNANAVGYMKASSDTKKLALGIRDTGFELFDFSNATGKVANAIFLPAPFRAYGVEFSPDGSRLYGSDLNGYRVLQFNLQAGSVAAIVASRVEVGNTSGYAGALQIAPDGKIYVAQYNQPYLSAIANPNGLGTACNFQREVLNLGAAICQVGLPNGMVAQAAPVPSVSFIASAVCIGKSTTFQASVQNVPGATLVWDFGDPASGVANTGSGPSVAHIYGQAGISTVTLTVTGAGLAQPLVVKQNVTVYPLPTISLGPPRQLCVGQQVELGVGSQPTGSTYRWQDGSTSATYQAQQPGLYSVTVTSPQGCTAETSTTVALLPKPVVTLGPDTSSCFLEPLVLRVNPQPAGSTYRWQDGSTSATYQAQQPGTYSVKVTSPDGCTAQSDLVVRDAECPFMIPNIITPNKDRFNQKFVLKGLNPQAWDISIYNRWGREVYQKKSYDNGWDAEGQPDGVYYYLLRNPTTSKQYKGWVQVVR